ncbi:MAG: carnitine dehydratase [Chloroflexota bacterium]
MTGILEGIRVVALEQAVAGPLCTRHLADLGAEVIKIERPGEGDFGRYYDSAIRGLSAWFAWLNRTKRSLTLNLKSPQGIEILHRLLAGADVLVENLGPGVADRLGLTWESLAERYPQLIVCRITAYGRAGPYRDRKAFDLLVQGETAVIALTGTPEAPAKVAVSVADIGAGLYAFASILAALYRRTQTGRGTKVEVSLFDALAEWVSPFAYGYLYTGRQPERAGMRHNIIVPYGPYKCADGYVNIAIQNEAQWVRFCAQVLGMPELARDPDYATIELRVRNRGRLEPLIEKVLSQWPVAEVARRLEAADVPYGLVRDLAGFVEHPQLAARDRWVEVESPVGPVRQYLPPFDFADAEVRLGRIPAVGEHTEEVLRELGFDPETIERLRKEGVV